MPIRPENKTRYPANWKAVVTMVRERSGDRCEGSPAFPDCRVPNYSIGYRTEKGEWREVARGDRQRHAEAQIPYGDVITLVRIILTVGHLDHQPENCALDNLRHWCQRCHLVYDQAHHAETAYRTRRQGRAIDMFGE